MSDDETATEPGLGRAGYGRRNVLKTVAAGGLASVALAGGAAAQGRAVAYMTGSPSEGDTHELFQNLGSTEAKCNQPPHADGHEVDGWTTDPFCFFGICFPIGPTLFVQSDSLSLAVGDTVEVAKVIGECRESGLTKVLLREV